MSVTPPTSIRRDDSEDRGGGDTMMVESVDIIELLLGVSKAELFDSGDTNLTDSEVTKRLAELLDFGDTELLDPEAIEFFDAEDNELVIDFDDEISLNFGVTELLDSVVTKLLDS